MTPDKLLEELAFEEKVLAQEFEETIDENLKEFERSLLEKEITIETNEVDELNLELLMDELVIHANETTPALCEEENSSALEDIIMILKKYPELKITLSL